MSVYGAWELKTGYQKYLAFGFGSSLGLFSCVFLASFLFRRALTPPPNTNDHSIVFKLTPAISKPLNRSPAGPVRPLLPTVQLPKSSRFMVDSLIQAMDFEWPKPRPFPYNDVSEKGMAGTGGTGAALSGSPEGTIIDLDEFNLRPVLLFKVDPKCPEAARRRRMTGTVIAVVLVGNDGLVREVSIKNSTNEIFDDEVNEALKLWIFRPWVERNRCFPFRFTVMVEFVLR